MTELATRPRLPVAINTTSLLGAMTGVGYYTASIIQSLAGQSIEGHGYRQGNWHSLDDHAQSSGYPTRTLRRSGLRRGLSQFLRTMPGMSTWLGRRHLARERQALDAGLRARGIRVYHEPNFVAPVLDVPTVLTVHDLSCFRYPQYHPADRVRYMQQHLPGAIERAAAIIAVSEFSRREIVEYFGVPDARVHVVLEAAGAAFQPVSVSAREARLKALGVQDRSFFLFVGAIEPRKNLGLVLDALAALPPALCEAHPLLLVGAPGWRRESFQQRLDGMIEKGWVREMGYLPRADLPLLYSACTGFVFPSRYEGFGLPPLEAMACGAPVVVSDQASLPEVVGDAALIVPVDDPGALAEAMQRLIEDQPLAKSLSAQGKQRAAGFSWARAGEQTAAIYRQVAHA